MFGCVRLGLAKGALYEPDAGPAPHVGVIVLHRTSNYLSHPACALRSMSAPLLITAMGAHDFVCDDEKMYESARAPTRSSSPSKARCTPSRPARPARRRPGNIPTRGRMNSILWRPGSVSVSDLET
jgi:hypothetical protein